MHHQSPVEPACRGCVGELVPHLLLVCPIPVRIAILLLVRTAAPTASHYQRKERLNCWVTPIIPYSSLCKHTSGGVDCSQMAIPLLNYTHRARACIHSTDWSFTSWLSALTNRQSGYSQCVLVCLFRVSRKRPFPCRIWKLYLVYLH